MWGREARPPEMGDEIVLNLNDLLRLASPRVAALDNVAALLRLDEPVFVDIPALDPPGRYQSAQAVGAQHARQFPLHGEVILLSGALPQRPIAR